MATKKSTEETPDVSRSMNVWRKLLAVRNEFLEQGSKKSGKNLHAEFTYYELVDIVPKAEALFFKYGLFMQPYMTDTTANAQVVNTDNPDEAILFSIPLQLISEPGKFRMNEVQGVGAAVTYYRRYLYMLVLDLVETDAIDNQKAPDGEDEPSTPAPKRSAAPVSTSDREKIKEELTGSEAQASEDQVDSLKALLKRLLELDPENESFVQEIAVRTNSFAEIKATACDALIENVADMISAYPSQEA